MKLKTRSLKGKRKLLLKGPNQDDFSGQSYPIPMSESEIQELRKRFNSNLPAKIVPSTVVPFPEGKTSEDYDTMHVLPGNRVGFETKQAYIQKLGDLYAEGYLTEEEYDTRVSWVNISQTQQQIDLVFKDLSAHLLELKAKTYLLDKKNTIPHKKKISAGVIAPMIIVYLFVITIMIMLMASGAWVGGGILAFEMVAVSFAFVKAVRKL